MDLISFRVGTVTHRFGGHTCNVGILQTPVFGVRSDGAANYLYDVEVGPGSVLESGRQGMDGVPIMWAYCYPPSRWPMNNMVARTTLDLTYLPLGPFWTRYSDPEGVWYI